MMKVRLTKDIESPWNKRKTLPRGRELTVHQDIGKKMIEEKQAVPIVENPIKEIRKKSEII
jgi:hypothetical protein